MPPPPPETNRKPIDRWMFPYSEEEEHLQDGPVNIRPMSQRELRQVQSPPHPPFLPPCVSCGYYCGLYVLTAAQDFQVHIPGNQITSVSDRSVMCTCSHKFDISHVGVFVPQSERRCLFSLFCLKSVGLCSHLGSV